ncbi:MAG TPA: GntR family transcriptional regulator, partial [Kribbella sp.]|nr:GntR family transcriptional regulator [Kribbella sp.]
MVGPHPTLWSDHTDTVVRVKNYELVLHRVEAELAAGRLRIGGRLPGERALAEQLGISRPSVREAVRVLEA